MTSFSFIFVLNNVQNCYFRVKLWQKGTFSCPNLYILMDLGLYVIIFYVFCKQDEKFNKRTLFDDFLIFTPLKLPTMVILKQQNTVKRGPFFVSWPMY